MAVAIAAGVGVFLAAQEVRLIPQAWSEETAVAHLGPSAARDAGSYTAAIAANPDDYMGYYRRGLHYEGRSKLDLALADLDRAVALSPTPVSRTNLGDDATGMLSPEVRVLNRVVFVRLVRANILAKLGREREALADLNHAIALDHRKYSAVFARASLLTTMERYNEAIVDYDQLLARHDDAGWSFGRGVARFHTGDFAGAAEDFREAARRVPQDATFQNWLSKATLKTSLAAQ